MSVCIWKNSSECVVWVSQCLQGDSPLARLLVYLGNTSLLSEEDLPLCCQAFYKVPIVPILGFLHLQELWILRQLGHLRRGLFKVFYCWESWGVAHDLFHLVNTYWCLFSPLAFHGYLQIGSVVFYFSMKHSLWFSCYTECYNSIKHCGIGPWPRLVETQWYSLPCCYIKETLFPLWCP